MSADSPETPATLERDLSDAIDNAMRTHDGALVTKWVTVVEVIGSDGKPARWTVTNDDSPPWDTLSLLDFAAQTQRAEITAAHVWERSEGTAE